MGLSYNIIPTSELVDTNAYLEHFKSIETYLFPDNYKVNIESRFPSLLEIKECISKSECQIISNVEEVKEDKTIRISYQLKHEKHKYESDFTIHHKEGTVKSMMGIHGDFNILLRVVTELTNCCGNMIIWSAYDAHYIETERTYEQIWNKLKGNWAGEE